jgi:hypothetical protein
MKCVETVICKIQTAGFCEHGNEFRVPKPEISRTSEQLSTSQRLCSMESVGENKNAFPAMGYCHFRTQGL